MAVLRKIAKTNRKDVPDQVFESFEAMANAQFQKSLAAEGGKNMSSLFRTPRLRSKVLLLSGS